MFFQVTIKYDKMMENGTVKMGAKDTYLFDALTFVEAETRAVEKIAPYVSGDFTVDAITKTKISEVIPSNIEGKWYKVTYGFKTIDEKTGEEKRSTVIVMVEAEFFMDALTKFEFAMQGTVVDYDIISIQETKILEYFPLELANSQNNP